MRKLVKNFFILILTIVFVSAFSTSYSSLNIDNIVVVVAIGLDISENNNLKLSFQFTNPISVSGKETGGSEQSPSIIYTVDASSISTGINIMNTYIAKKVNLSHCKLIAFSEELATRGITDEVFTLINEVQIRPSTNIAVTKCSAKNYLEHSKPLTENLLPKYYEIFSKSSEYTGFVSNSTIGNFFNSLNCKSCEPYAILGGLTSQNKAPSTNINSQQNYSIKSNESSITGQNRSENIGIAVFKEGKLVGELNAIETLCFLTTKNKVNEFLISVPDSENENEYIDVYMIPNNNSNITIDIINGSPYIKVNYKFDGRIYSMKKNSKYLDNSTLESLSDSCNTYLESVIKNFLYKTSKNFNSDITEFGLFAQSNFLTIKEFENYSWNEKYKDSFFDVTVNTKIRSSFLLTET